MRPMTNTVDIPLYTLNMESDLDSTWYFGSGDAPAIPAGFFGWGSDPWFGGISCAGIPLDPKGDAPTADLIVRHERIEWIPNPETRYGPREIPKSFNIRCCMAKLHEHGSKPIVVTYDNGKRSENWDVEVNLATNHPDGGMIMITWINADGNSGYADIEIAVKVEFTFTQQGTGKVYKFTSPTEWLSETGHEWTRYADADALAKYYIPKESQGNFIPASHYVGGAFEPMGKCSANNVVKHSFTLSPTIKTLNGAPPGKVPYLREIPLRESTDSSF